MKYEVIDIWYLVQYQVQCSWDFPAAGKKYIFWWNVINSISMKLLLMSVYNSLPLPSGVLGDPMEGVGEDEKPYNYICNLNKVNLGGPGWFNDVFKVTRHTNSTPAVKLSSKYLWWHFSVLRHILYLPHTVERFS